MSSGDQIPWLKIRKWQLTFVGRLLFAMDGDDWRRKQEKPKLVCFIVWWLKPPFAVYDYDTSLREKKAGHLKLDMT
jgi:hypothetical protein